MLKAESAHMEETGGAEERQLKVLVADIYQINLRQQYIYLDK